MAKINGNFKEAGKGSLASTKEVKEKKSITAPHKKINFADLGAFTISKIDEQRMEQVAVAEVKAMSASDGIESGKEGVTGLAANNDFVEDVALGDMTNLNTTEFKYYGFYHRIRQKLEQYWGNSIQEKAKKLYKGGRRLPSSENMITAITVILDNHGSIVDIKVDGTSGVRELDQAAIESFNKAGPFPNPPKGLLVDGRAVIQWGFVVKG
jgi:protein TonB